MLRRFLVCVLAWCVDVAVAQVPASLLLGLWPLTQQFGQRDLSGEERHGTNAGEVTIRAGSHYKYWNGGALSYISLPGVPSANATSGYVHIYAEILIDSATVTPGEAQAIIHLGDDVTCSLDAYYLDGGLYLQLTNAGATTSVSLGMSADILKRVYLEFNVCTSGMGAKATQFPCLAITDAVSFTYRLQELTPGSFCANLYSSAEVGRAQGVGASGLRGTLSCLAFYTGRIEERSYYANQTPDYIHNNYCSGERLGLV